VRLQEGRVGLRPIRPGDAADWSELRRRNVGWLRQWEATTPPGSGAAPASARAMIRELSRQAREGRSLPFVVTYEGRLAGQLTVSGIAWGSACWAQVGYWIDRDHAGRGIIPTALALATDHCMGTMGLHRIEVAIRPENTASLRVVEKLGFRLEGRAPRYLHIDGAWRDHLVFALTVEDVPDGLLASWRRSLPARD
jgi:[ribosomal protein S5]-alanine N-acetyltransferase